MRVWKVKVLLEGFQPPKKLGKPQRPIREWLVVLLEAEDSSAPMSDGQSYADRAARPSVRWVGITAMEAVSVQLPMEFHV
jgi:hypothetical protein